MQLHSLTVDGHTSIERAHLELRDINVLVGANGAGKSNVIRALELLGRIADDELQLSVGLAGGASALLHQPSADTISLRILGGDGTNINSYKVELQATADDRLIFCDEQASFQAPGYSRPHETHLGAGHRETLLRSAAGGDGVTTVSDYVLALLRGCRVFHFHDTGTTAAVTQPQPAADDLTLQSDARNLAAVLRRLRDAEPRSYGHITRSVRQVAPFFRDFVLEPDHTDRIQLRWRANDSDTVFSAFQMSDGTLRFICLATLLLQPTLPELIALDEPELGLHPAAIVQLADMLQAVARRGSQLLVATQSVTFIDQFQLDDLVIVERANGGTVAHRPDPATLADWLTDYSLGDLWLKNLLGGRPGRNDR